MRVLHVATAIAWTIACGSPVSAAEPPPGALSCSGCHGSGASASPFSTRLYGRNAGEVVTAMTGFRDGSLPSTVMNRIAKGFSDDETRAIAAWLAAQK